MMQQSEPFSKAASLRQLDFLSQKSLPHPEEDLHEREDRDVFDERLAQSEKTVRHYVKMSLIWFLAALACIVISVYFWNLLAPDCWRWMSDKNMEQVQGIVISIVSGLIMSLAISNLAK